MSTSRIEALQRLADWDGLRRLDQLVRDLRTRPNIFAIAPRILRVEGVHSDLLGWLLDPRGWHGLGDRFAAAIVNTVFSRCGDGAARDVEIRDVWTEASTGRGPIDLLLTGTRDGRPFALGIENKIDASESPGQLRKYSEGLLARFPHTDVRVALLTIDGTEPDLPPLCPYSAITHRTIADLLDAALSDAAPESAASVGHQLAIQYLHALRSSVMGESDPRIDELCRELLRAHGEAWRAIRQRLPSQRDEIHAALATLACQRFESEFGGEWRYSLKRDRYARIYRPVWRVYGESRGERILGLEDAPEFDAAYSATHLRLAADLPDDDLSERHRYVAKLKVSNRSRDDELSTRTVAELAARDLEPERNDGFTIDLKSKTGLPSVLTSPDAVMDWLAALRRLRQAIQAIDAAASPATASGSAVTV